MQDSLSTCTLAICSKTQLLHKPRHVPHRFSDLDVGTLPAMAPCPIGLSARAAGIMILCGAPALMLLGLFRCASAIIEHPTSMWILSLAQGAYVRLHIAIFRRFWSSLAA